MEKWSGKATKKEMPDLENGIAKGIYYLLMLFVLIAFFQTLRITLITEPLTALLNRLFDFFPQLIGAGVLLFAGWAVAKVLQIVTRKALIAAKFDERISSKLGNEGQKTDMTGSIADAVYGLVFLLFIPAILDALSLEGLLSPVQGMIDKILGFLPNIATAVIILIAGWFVSRLLQRIVTNLLAAAGIDTFSENSGISQVIGSQKLSAVIGMLLYVFLLIPVAIASLNTLQLEAVTLPASNMLNIILEALPHILAAIIVVGLSYVIGRVAAGLVANLLEGVGFDSLVNRLGITMEKSNEQWTPSKTVGYLSLLAIVFFSVLESSRLLGFTALADLLAQFMVLAGRILLGLVIFAIGLGGANLAAKTIENSGVRESRFLVSAARIAVIVFAGAMALRQMGLANEIINLAFGLLLGAFALAIAIAFGLGSKEIAAREVDGWIDSFRKKPEEKFRNT